MAAVSHPEDSLGPDEAIVSRPSFEVALRGYDRSEVDQYMARVEHDMATLVADRQRARAEVDELKTLVQQLRAEVTELQGRPIQIDRAAFSDMGPMIEQMLTLAEKQASAIVSHATQRAASREAEAEKILNEAQERSTRLTRDLEAQLGLRRKTADTAHSERVAAADAEHTQIRQEIERLRAQLETDRAEAAKEAKNLADQNERHVERARTEARALVDAGRTEAAHEIASRRVEIEREIGERRAEAAQKIAALHAQAQLQADELHSQLTAQAAAHQQQMDILLEEIKVQRQTLAQIQSELNTADQKLAHSAQQQSSIDTEVAQQQQRLSELGQALSAENQRLEQARQAGLAAEQHAREVRQRVQREAQRVAERAAAAVLAAAAVGGETGEFPQIVLAPEPDAGAEAPNGHPAGQNGNGNGVPLQRGPHPAAAGAPANGVREHRQPQGG
jgi:peptidoglycan DL-endopeptidase RipA